MKVNGKDYPIYEMENKKCFETTNQIKSHQQICIRKWPSPERMFFFQRLGDCSLEVCLLSLGEWRHMINTDTPWSPEDRRCLVYLVLFTMSNKLGKLIKLISKQLSNLSLPTRYDYTIWLYHIIIGNCEDISEISKVPTIPNCGNSDWFQHCGLSRLC